jgi:2-polyprenyl-3-methyl-5-hydroxy-6-metoxy-1,4-benzoquinol methylase
MGSPLRSAGPAGDYSGMAEYKQIKEVVLSCNVCQSHCIQKVDAQYNLCRCEDCGYVFDSPRPTATEVARFYSRPAKYDSWLKEERGRDGLWRRRLNKLLPYKAEGSLLDVGAGIGQFLHHAQPFFTQVAGTEVSESAIRIAREKYGINLFAGQIEELDLPLGSFDNITLFHVLEHVSDPMRLIRRCCELLRPRGVLAIAVPNDVLAWTSGIKKLGKRIGLRSFQKFSPVLGIARAGESREIHLSHFTSAVLRKLVKSSGLGVVEESLDPYYASSGMQFGLDSVYCGLHWTLHTVLKVNYYDTIWMIARKP